MEYPTRVPAQTASKVDRPRQTLEQWSVDVCKVKDCFDGFLSREVDGYDTLFACPMCDRHGRELAGYQSIPTAKHWMGSVVTYTPQEMIAIVNRRQEVAQSLKRGAARIPNIQPEMVGDGPF